MKTVEILKGAVRTLFKNRLIPIGVITPLLTLAVAVFATLLAVTPARGAAFAKYSECVPDMTTYLLTAPLTTAQRQALHAQNFNQLSPALRPVYLHAVAYSLGFMVISNGQVPNSGMLANHLQTVGSIYEVPAGWQDDWEMPWLVARNLLQGLNTLISAQVSNSTSYQQAMCAGAIDSFNVWSDEAIN